MMNIVHFLCVFILILNEVKSENPEPKIDVNQIREEAINAYQISFQNIFKKTRIQQQDAIKQILQIDNSERQRDMIAAIIKKVVETITQVKEDFEPYTDIKELIEKSIKDEKLRGSLSILMESASFTGDLALHFPEYFHRIYDRDENLQRLIKWTVEFVQKTKFFDETSLEMLHLVSQELNIIPREPDYTNPYSHKRIKKSNQPSEKTQKEKKKRQRGPGMSGGKNEL